MHPDKRPPSPPSPLTMTSDWKSAACARGTRRDINRNRLLYGLCKTGTAGWSRQGVATRHNSDVRTSHRSTCTPWSDYYYYFFIILGGERRSWFGGHIPHLASLASLSRCLVGCIKNINDIDEVMCTARNTLGSVFLYFACCRLNQVNENQSNETHTQRCRAGFLLCCFESTIMDFLSWNTN